MPPTTINISLTSQNLSPDALWNSLIEGLKSPTFAIHMSRALEKNKGGESVTLMLPVHD